MPSTPGRSRSTGSRRRKSPDPVKVAKMVADALEIAPRVMIPLEVRIGARETHLLMRFNDRSGVIDVLNTEDGNEYQILVISKRQELLNNHESRSSR